MDRQEHTGLFLRLAGINAVSANEQPLAEHLISLLRELGFTPYTDSSARSTGSNTGNVICPVNGGGSFMLLSHMDTARPTTGMKPVFHEDRITSDGTTVLGVDNRLGITSIIYALQELVREGKKIRPCYVAFTVCEETTLGGSLHLEIPEPVNRCFIFDSGYRPGTFVAAACGAMRFTAEIHGKASHSGISPEKGVNAIAAAAAAIARLRQGRIDHETTMNIGVINGGSATNVVSHRVFLDGEVRSFHEGKVVSMIRDIGEVFDEECSRIGATVDYHAEWDFRPYTLTPEHSVYTGITDALTAIGLQPTPVLSLGGSDANSINGRGIPAVNIGIGAQNPHGNDEFVLLEDLTNSARIARELLEDKEP